MNPSPSQSDAPAVQSSLRRELWAIVVLYLTQLVLPILIGLAFGPESP